MKDTNIKGEKAVMLVLIASAVLIVPMFIITIMAIVGVIDMSILNYTVMVSAFLSIALLLSYISTYVQLKKITNDITKDTHDKLSQVISENDNVSDSGIEIEIIKRGLVEWRIIAHARIEIKTVLVPMTSACEGDIPKSAIDPSEDITPMTPVMVDGKETIKHIKELNDIINKVLLDAKQNSIGKNIEFKSCIRYEYKTLHTSYDEYGERMVQMRCMTLDKVNQIKDVNHIEEGKITETRNVPCDNKYHS